MPLACQRARFEIPDGVAYLNCANLSPRLSAVSQAGVRALQRTASPWALSGVDWFANAERLRDLFARIANADADGVALVPSVSYGIATAAANVPIAAGQSILLLDREFPSNVYAWRDAARRRGAHVRTVRRQPGGTWTDTLLASLDACTAVVAVPNCHWTDGSLIDLARVAPAARRVGAALVVDASQSIGAYPLDVAEIQPDFLVTVGYKWLLGPYGLGYLYVAPRWREGGVPLEHSWLARAGSEDFARLVEYTDGYRHGARRFDMGEFPQFILAPMAIAALEQVLEWGVARIQRSLSVLVSQATAGAAEFGGVPPPGGECVGHMTGIRLSGGGLPDGLIGAFAAAQVYVSIRGDSIRVAPHVQNDPSDIEQFLDVLRKNLPAKSGTRRGPGPGARSRGTWSR